MFYLFNAIQQWIIFCVCFIYMLEPFWKSVTIKQDGGNTQNGVGGILKHPSQTPKA